MLSLNNTTRWLPQTLCALCALLAACNDSDPSSSAALSPELLTEARELFEGAYALQVTTTTEQELPVIGLSRSSSVAKKLLKVREEEGRFIAEETFCHIEMSTDGPVSPSVPSTLVSYVPSVESSFYVEKTEAGWRWERERSGTVLGARLESPLEDVLPSSAEDALVFDQDMDGNPGVTLKVSGLVDGEIYALIRYVDALSGELDDGHWSGYVEDETEQVIVGASSAVLNVNVSPRAVDDPSLNTVIAYPLGSTGDCEAALARLDQGDEG